MKKLLVLAASGCLAFGVAACGDDDSKDSGSSSGGGDLTGSVKIDGSSTVGPFAQAAAEQFQGENSGVKISVGTSGTGGGFEKFCAGETDISDASRPIKDDEEVPICKKNGVTLQGDRGRQRRHRRSSPTRTSKIDCLTVDQLKTAVERGLEGHEVLPTSTRSSPTPRCRCSARVRSPARSTSSPRRSTAKRASRARTYQPSEDDNVLVQGVEGEQGGLGYFGFSYYEQNQDKLNLVGVDAGDGKCVKPSEGDDPGRQYKPLSRPIFMYPSEKTLAKPQVKGFMDYVIANQRGDRGGGQIVPLNAEQLDRGRRAEVREASRLVASRPAASDGSLLHDRGARAGPALGRRARRVGEELIKGLLAHGGPDLGPHNHGHSGLARPRDDRVLRRGRPIGRLRLRHEVGAAGRASPSSLGVLPLISGTFLVTGHRARGRDPAGPRLGDLPLRVRHRRACARSSSRSWSCSRACRRSSSATSR